MEVSDTLVQELAPDQPSINAAKKLLKPAKWPVLGQAQDVNTIWGECQGSGSTPYYTMADVSDHGYKCTCPSRKFPCKHVLALFWQFSDLPDNFAKTAPPQWVNDWLGRRRRSTSTTDEASAQDNAAKISKSAAPLSLHKTNVEKVLTDEELAKREEDKAKRAAQNRAKTLDSVAQGLTELQQWINDQLSSGIVQFLKDSRDKCRQIAARLVDAKAANLAARIDELPAKILAQPVQHQPSAALQELAKLALLSEAWLSNPQDIDAYRSVVSSENREQVLSPNTDENSTQPLTINGTWQVIGEKSQMRRNGLLASMRWLKLLSPSDEQTSTPATAIAMLLDFIPVKSGSSKTQSALGKTLKGKVTFYASRMPYRAILGEHEYMPQSPTNQQMSHIQEPLQDWRLHFLQHHAQLPWLEEVPFITPAGRISQDKSGQYWWQNNTKTVHLPLINEVLDPLILGSQLDTAFVLLDGQFAELISVETASWGVILCQ
ncbi:hypothetical protein HJP15_10055 [Pseudoalteromonas sp. NEC-BIFX-2020_002]|uniref:SWIM zinc finger family protein n=1 Tax=Pseudoalteromonas sp. NEC-BIFX-2020_002 TaxID=2732353 RepID=UPI001476ECE1|nr:SWIM zinc finger family protein [Pseudoalteromonas sp. NEC-BIFX-2020_002]NNG43253.1 hypothetical protein [Pseudoalteromonas sp. NEC-BIFX-2020_002]